METSGWRLWITARQLRLNRKAVAFSALHSYDFWMCGRKDVNGSRRVSFYFTG